MPLHASKHIPQLMTALHISKATTQ